MAVWLLLGLAVIAANLPWLSDRFMFIITPGGGTKQIWMRLLEWLLLALLTGIVAMGVERRATGGAHEQGWEFYVVGLFLFMVFAIPGFIWRHQWLPFRARGRGQQVKGRR
jgi:hypothetical protein